MTSGPVFGSFRCAWDVYGNGLPPRLFYKTSLDAAIQRGALKSQIELGDTRLAIEQEIEFIESGRHYFKVWPNMLAAMSHVKLDIDESYLHAPFNAFQIRLPLRDNVLEHEPGNPVTAILVAFIEPENDDRKIVVCHSPGDRRVIDGVTKIVSVHYQFLNGHSTRMDGGMRRGESLEDNLVRFGSVRGTATYQTSVEFRRNVFAVTVAVCMFAISNHELIMPDIHREVLTIKAKTKGQRISEQKRIERELAKCKGWKVGSEIDLPRPFIRRESTNSDGTGRELEYGHIRSGHMRMQSCGKQNKDRKLIFVMPALIRPDLPIRATQGFRIHDRILK